MTGSENPITLEHWQASSPAFGLYLVIGTILALLVVGIMAVCDKGHRPEGSKQSVTIQRSLNAGANAGKSNMHKKNSESSLHVNKQ